MQHERSTAPVADRVRPLTVVMGVSGSGKSTIGALLATRLSVAFLEGDDLHPAANIARMGSGRPLDDDDRAPWLECINDWMRGHQSGGVVSCSALRRTYRDSLRRGLCIVPTFILLDPSVTVLRTRLAARRGHFMSPMLLDSQLATLERPASDERVLILDGDRPVDDAVDELMVRLEERMGG